MLAIVAACAEVPADREDSTSATQAPTTAGSPDPTEGVTDGSTTGVGGDQGVETEPAVAASEPPPWLGTEVLPPGEEGFGAVLPTPPELEDRRIRTVDRLPPPTDGFESEVVAVPDDVLARSTWSEGCPVGRRELRYVTVSHWGFDDEPHTGELLVHRDVADDLVTVFRTAWDARFPIEEMRIVTAEELDAPPTGDGNNTTAFVCRATRGSQRWSEHAYGLAVDVNPFHNPYVRDSIVLPELASAYVDRDWVRPGMLFAHDRVVAAFRAIGWHWGGDWERPIDWMHFSRGGG